MTFLRFLDSRFDLDFARKVLAGFLFFILSWIPVDCARAFFFQLRPAAGKDSLENLLSVLRSQPVRALQDYEPAFQAGSFFGSALPGSTLTVFKASIHELAKDYRLKGVMMLGEAEAIIEDARTQKSLFVKKDEKLGELEVREIRESAVVLSYYGEETVLQIE